MKRNSSNPVSYLFTENLNEGKIALYQPVPYGFKSITYGGLRDSVYEMAGVLKEKGVGPGDEVLIMLPFSIDMYVAVISVLARGACAVFVEPWIKREIFRKVCKSIKGRFAITSPAGKVFLRMMGLKKEFIRRGKGCGGDVFHSVEKIFPAVITFTTGSSGIPTKVTRTYGELFRQADRLSRHIEEGRFVDFVMFPNLVLLNLYYMRSTLLPPRKLKKNFLKEAVERLSLDRLFISSSALPFAVDKEIGERLHRIYTGGSIIPTVFLESTGIINKTVIFYGCTQIEPISVVSGQEYVAWEGDGYYAGKIESDLEYRISFIEKDGGILYVRFPGENWVNTGDVVRIRKENIELLGRKMDLSILNQRIIYPYVFQRMFEDTGRIIFPLAKENCLYIVVEGRRDLNLEKVIKTKSIEKTGIKPGVVFIKKIPKDPRHGAKVDSRRLRKIVKNYL